MTAGILFGILFLMLFVGVPIAICLRSEEHTS